MASGTEKRILVLNSGSSSVKFALFSADGGLRRVLSGALERIGLVGSRIHAKEADGTVAFDGECDITDHDSALDLLLKRIDERPVPQTLAAVGHRVVHGDADCDCPLLVTPELEDRIRQLVPLMPLHLPNNLAGIAAVRTRRPELPQVACFDTAFHHDLPRVARVTGLPRQMEEHGIRRYGYHGLSYEYVLAELERVEGVAAARQRLVVLHLGNGASMAAIRNGKSIETTMGFSSLDGLLMGTRCGDLDPGIVLYLLNKLGMTAEAIEELLYQQSGLLGVSGISRNMQDLLAKQHMPEAAEAIDLFCYRARHYLGALTAVLGGLDRIVFTGGIGANAPEIRARICGGLSYLGIAIDRQRNLQQERTISSDGSGVMVQAFPTDEELMIARHTYNVIAAGLVSQELREA
jgi:acetate kinase